MKTRILLVLSIAALAGCSELPVYTVGTEPKREKQEDVHFATVEIESDPVGATLQVNSGGDQVAPARIRVELNESGMLLETTRIDLDLSNVIYRGSVRDTVGTVILRAGEPPPKRIQVSRGSPTGITVRFLTN